MNALIIKIKDNPMAVVLDDAQLANRVKDALINQNFEERKHSFASLQHYLNVNPWSIQVVEITRTENFQAMLDRMVGKIAPATHHPETFPHPGHTKIPGQKQLVRKQVVTPLSPPASPESDRSHPAPGVAREHMRVSSKDREGRQEHEAQEQ